MARLTKFRTLTGYIYSDCQCCGRLCFDQLISLEINWKTNGHMTVAFSGRGVEALRVCYFFSTGPAMEYCDVIPGDVVAQMMTAGGVDYQQMLNYCMENNQVEPYYPGIPTPPETSPIVKCEPIETEVYETKKRPAEDLPDVKPLGKRPRGRPRKQEWEKAPKRPTSRNDPNVEAFLRLCAEKNQWFFSTTQKVVEVTTDYATAEQKLRATERAIHEDLLLAIIPAPSNPDLSSQARGGYNLGSKKAISIITFEYIRRLQRTLYVIMEAIKQGKRINPYTLPEGLIPVGGPTLRDLVKIKPDHRTRNPDLPVTWNLPEDVGADCPIVVEG
jgi:hypothetical protein